MFELRDDELKLFFIEHKKTEFCKLVKNSFRLPVEKVPYQHQDEFLELKTDSSTKGMFDKKSLTEFYSGH